MYYDGEEQESSLDSAKHDAQSAYNGAKKAKQGYDNLSKLHNAGGELGKEAGKEALKEGAKEAAKEAAKKAAEEAAIDAAGAATAGVGKVAGEALRGAKNVISSLVNFAENTGQPDEDTSAAAKIIIGVVLCLVLLTSIPALFTSYLCGNQVSTIDKSRDEQAFIMDTEGEMRSAPKDEEVEVVDEKPKNRSIFGIIYNFISDVIKAVEAVVQSVYQHFVAIMHWDSVMEGSDVELEQYNKLNAYDDGTAQTIAILDEALVKAREQSWKDTEFIIEREQYDYKATKVSYDNNPVLFGDNSANKAEFLAIMTEAEEFGLEEVTYQKYIERLSGTEHLRRFYRLHIEPKDTTRFVARDVYGVDSITYGPNGEPLDGDEFIHWGLVTLRKWYLIDIYRLFEIDPYDENYRYRKCANIELLDTQERVIRRFSDLKVQLEDEFLEEIYGSTERSELDGEPENTLDPEEPYEEELDPEFDAEVISHLHDLISDEEVFLQIMRYLNQGTEALQFTRGDGSTTVQSSACCDLSYVMVVEYLTGKTFDIQKIEKEYVTGRLFNTSKFCDENKLTSTGNISINGNPSSIINMQNQIKNQHPVILYIHGKTNYHSSPNGHFLVANGYNSQGFYVSDPGRKSNTFISYEELLKDAARDGTFGYRIVTEKTS